ncbi:MAG: hypothetical protein JSV88_30175 [Candidatus Aminicenantes bacterium]|nr:MAG: hypothetical protein JSV88_30175 [Candidatus Aminicenantes bacterium]
MAIINDNSVDSTTPFPFYQYFTDLEFNTWKQTLEKYEGRINPLTLVLYLEDKWADRLSGWPRLSNQARDELVNQAGKVIDLVREKYASPAVNAGSTTIEDYLVRLEKQVRQKKQELIEQALRHDILGLIKEKHWLECSGYIMNIKIETGDYSEEFLQFLQESKKTVESGRDWIRRKGKLRRLIEQEDLADPFDLVKQCLTDRDNIKDLYDCCGQYGDDNDREELDKLAKDYYTRAMNLVKNLYEPTAALKAVDKIEKSSKDMFPDPPGEWNAYKTHLSDQLKDSINEDLEKVLEEGDLDNLGEAVDRLESTVITPLEIPDIDSYVQAHLDSLRKLCEDSHILDTIPKSADVESLKNLLNKVDDVGKDVEIKKTQYGEMVYKSTLFKELEGKYKKTRDMVAETLEILGRFNDVVDLLEEESRKILQGSEFRVSLNTQKYQQRMNSIERELLRLVKLHDNIVFLFNLKERVKALNQLIFQGSPEHKAEPQVELLGEVAEKVSIGDRFYEKIGFLSQPQNNEPLSLMDQVLDIMKENQNKSFIFRNSISTPVVDNLEEIMGKIRRKIDEELSAMEEIVTRFYQLPSPSLCKNINQFHQRFLFIQEKKAGLTGDFDDIKKLLEARRERMDKINDLGRVLELIHSQQYSEARDLAEVAASFEEDLRDQVEAVIYFNQHLHKRPWNESHWLYFFEHHCLHLVTAENQSQYQELFNQYETHLKKELFNLTPRDLEKHAVVFENYRKNSDLFAYIMLITGKYTGKNFIEYIQTREPAKALYKGLLDYLYRCCLWPVIVDLYRAAYGDLEDAFGEAPLDTIHDTLEDQYHLLEERFISGAVNQQEIEFFGNSIPHDDEFDYYRKKHDLLQDIFGKYQEIRELLNRYKTQDTWKMSGIQEDLKKLEILGRDFSGKFEKIRIDRDWDETIGLLMKFCEAGVGILERFSIEPYLCRDGLDIDELEHVKDKASAAYCDKLSAFLNKLSGLWKDFTRGSEALSAAGWHLKDKFNNDFFDPLIQKWKQVEFSRLWKEENLPIPENLDDFFQMFKTIRDNLERFLGYMEKGKEEISRHRDTFKILDPFISRVLSTVPGD